MSFIATIESKRHGKFIHTDLFISFDAIISMRTAYNKIRKHLSSLLVRLGHIQKQFQHQVKVEELSVGQYDPCLKNIADTLTRWSSPNTKREAVAQPVISLGPVTTNGRIPLISKSHYSICIWHPYVWLTEMYSIWIRNNPRLQLVSHEDVCTAARCSEILLFSCGSNYAVNSLLEQIDISNKFVIIVSTNSEKNIRLHIRSRIDHYQNAYLIGSQHQFDLFITQILSQAIH